MRPENRLVRTNVLSHPFPAQTFFTPSIAVSGSIRGLFEPYSIAGTLSFLITCSFGVAARVQDLGSTIQRTLAESPQIAHCLNRIKAEGYEVSLVLEATIGFNKTGSRETAEVSTFDFKVEKSEPAPVRMTPLDKKFLRSLKISVEETEE
jgi:hypothetical protein